MAARTPALRLAALYATMERMRSAELRMAETDVDDAVCAAAIAGAVRAGHRADSRVAMGSGQRDEWHIAETARIAIEARMERLAKLRVERETLRDEAAGRHRLSRMQMEQMECAVERSEVRMRLEETRRMQAESDDRFASRQSWQRMKRR